MRILFVCSGNICRSPMAAEYCRQRAREARLSDLMIESAGTLGIEGQPAAEEAQRVMAEIGIDLSGHRSRGIRAEELAFTDYTLVMERRHMKHLNRHHPDSTDRRILLRAFEESSDPHPYPPDLVDPIGQPLSAFRELVPQITRSVDHLLAFLQERS